MEMDGKKDGVCGGKAALLLLDFHIEIRVVYGHNKSGKASVQWLILKRTMKSLKHQRLSINLQN